MEHTSQHSEDSNNGHSITNGAFILTSDDVDVEMPECHQIYSNDDEVFRAIALYIDYDFEPGKVRDTDDNNYEEDPYIANPNGQQHDLRGAPFCKFIDGEPGISAEDEYEELSGHQRVLQTVLIPCLYEYLEDYSTSKENEENQDENQKASDAENRADLLDKLNYELLLDRKSWRLRSRFAEECIKLCRKRKITADQVNHIICCFALTFMDDTINGVRIAGAELLAEIFSIFIEKEWPTMMLEDSNENDSNENGSKRSILESMPLTKALLIDARKGFLKSHSWRRRQTWAYVLEFLTKIPEVSLLQYFFVFHEDIHAVANDGVRNTRIKFCQIFQSLLEHRENEETINELFPSLYFMYRKMVEKMSKFDEDFEIQNQAKIILGHLNPSTDYLNYDLYRHQLIEKEDGMWRKFSILTGRFLDPMPQYFIEEFEIASSKSPSGDEV